MKVIVCVDDNGGVMFNNRRQSKDKLLVNMIIDITKNSKLWVSSYTASLFDENQQDTISISDDFLNSIKEDEYCFAEGMSLCNIEAQIQSVILFKWNRVYPADTYIDITLSEGKWQLVRSLDFKGYSHDKITMEEYVK